MQDDDEPIDARVGQDFDAGTLMSTGQGRDIAKLKKMTKGMSEEGAKKAVGGKKPKNVGDKLRLLKDKKVKGKGKAKPAEFRKGGKKSPLGRASMMMDDEGEEIVQS
jgi:hypothetical protein